MKRIDSIRRAITDWVQSEINIITEELGFNNKPKIKFSVDNLFDQPSYFKLLTELNDRNVISNQTIVEKIGEMWDIEKSRVAKEETERKEGSVSTKYSPFIQTEIPEKNHKKAKELLKLKEESGIGITSNTEKPPLPNGRPDGAKDTVKRKVSKRIRAKDLAAAEEFQTSVDDVLDSHFLKKFNVSNKRQMTAKQKLELEAAKDKVFSSYIGKSISEKEILEIGLSNQPTERFNLAVKAELSDFENPTTSNIRMVKNSILSQWKDQ